MLSPPIENSHTVKRGRQAEVWVTRRINTVSGFPPSLLWCYTTMDATFCYALSTVCVYFNTTVYYVSLQIAYRLKIMKLLELHNSAY